MKALKHKHKKNSEKTKFIPPKSKRKLWGIIFLENVGKTRKSKNRKKKKTQLEMRKKNRMGFKLFTKRVCFLISSFIIIIKC